MELETKVLISDFYTALSKEGLLMLAKDELGQITNTLKTKGYQFDGEIIRKPQQIRDLDIETFRLWEELYYIVRGVESGYWPENPFNVIEKLRFSEIRDSIVEILYNLEEGSSFK